MVTSPSIQSLVCKAPVAASFATLFLVLLVLRPVEALHGAFILPIVLASRSGVRAGLAGGAVAIGLESALLWTSRGAFLSDYAAYVFATWGLFIGSGIISGILFSYLSALNARLEDLTRRRDEENVALAEIGRIVTSSVEIGEVYQRFAQRVGELLDFDRLAIQIINVDERTFTQVHVTGLEIPERKPGVAAQLSGSMTETVLRRRSVVVVQNESAEDTAHQYPSLAPGIKAGIRSFLSVPLINKDEVIGVLNLRSATVNAYSDRDSKLAERVGTQIAGAIANAQLYAELEREVKEREVLAEIGRIIDASMDVHEVYQEFADQVRLVLPWDRITINVIDEKANEFRMAYVAGLQVPTAQDGAAMLLEGSPTAQVVANRSGLILDLEHHVKSGGAAPAVAIFKAGILTALRVPLVVGGAAIGTLSLGSRQSNAYDERDLWLAERIGAQIAGAIANSQLNQALRDSSVRLEATLGELERTQEELIRQERLRALGQMASGIAHDFNNSLMPILGFSQLLLNRREGVDDQELEKRYLLNINLAAEDAAAVVRRLREFYRRREEGPEFSPVLLDDVVAQALSLTRTKWKDEAQARGATIRVETELERVPALNGNESELRQALTNLIFNAVDAMPEGGSITIRSRLTGPNAVLEVSDTGGGMSDEVKRSCLDPFFTTKGPQGTGMGLPTVYGIVRRHRGTLDIESEAGRGTTFVITLPIHADVPQREGHPADSAAADGSLRREALHSSASNRS